MTKNDSPKLISISTAAQMLGVPDRTMRGWVARRVIATVRIGGRRLIELSALHALIEQARQAEALKKPNSR